MTKTSFRYIINWKQKSPHFNTNVSKLKQFLSELYVFLVDEMHKLLNDYLSVEDEPVPEIHLTDVEQLKCFAHEAEMNQNYDLAAYYYQEVI